MAIPRLYRCLPLILVLSGISATTAALEQVHLLGFVEQLCPHEPYCFELRVEEDSMTMAGRRIRVRFAGVTTIFDPENYELSLQASNIIPGSHLRLLLAPDPQATADDYIALFIWIGD